jgi:hypothetical protein
MPDANEFLSPAISAEIKSAIHCADTGEGNCIKKILEAKGKGCVKS